MSECSDQNQENETLRFVVEVAQDGLRLDKALADLAEGLSRSQDSGVNRGRARLRLTDCPAQRANVKWQKAM